MIRISDRTRSRYDTRIMEFGFSPKSLGWIKGNQGIRFLALTEIGIMNNSKIYDIGCGFGDLFRFLKITSKNFRYTGFELNPNLISMAKKKNPNTKFKQFDIEKEQIVGKCDWAIVSGLFNFKRKDNYKFIKNTIRKIFHLCNKGVAIDFLSTYVDYKNRDSFYSSPEKIFKICKELSPRIILRHDYMPFEFCVYIYKKNSISKNLIFNDFKKSIKKDFSTNKWLN